MENVGRFDNLPLGLRFLPTDVEIIDHYLRLKNNNGNHNEIAFVKEIDLCKVEPWDLPELLAITRNDDEWFFFCPVDRKHKNGQRSTKATAAGYWKVIGKDMTIKSRTKGLIGMKKTIVFHTSRTSNRNRTNWVIHEYRPTTQQPDDSNPGQDFVMCRLFKIG